MYIILDKFFFIFHTMLIGFNLFGWTWKKTRLANLITLLLTLLSWSILGIWFGFGYCPSTDWHWKVRARLGYLDMSSSYIKFLIDSFTGLDVSVKLINIWAVALLSIAIAASIVTNTVTIINKHLKKV
ncbi:MAG TPA: DUF2784 family protein [Spirochaetes bacterium]|nr:DUF2784 family protein [Spirochaetota bacterium]